MPLIDTEILDLLKNGEMSLDDICENVEAPRADVLKRRDALMRSCKIVSVRRCVYALSDGAGDTNAFFSGRIRTAESNGATIDQLLNLYDEVLMAYATLMRSIMRSNQNLEQKERFLKDFKDLTLIGDRLMKRWNLEHFGYDNNARQAQEDAKAKTRQAEEEQIANAPVEQQVEVLGSFDLRTKELIDGFPTLESLSEEETEEKTV